MASKLSKFSYAGPVARFILSRILKAHAITIPWPRGPKVYVLKEHDTPTLRAHENAHLAQIQRMGWTAFSLAYITQWVRYGYWNMPLEIEAQAAEDAHYVAPQAGSGAAAHSTLGSAGLKSNQGVHHGPRW